jgi:hypothetical protein
LTTVVDETQVKVVAWYDNEWGYSNRLVELATRVLVPDLVVAWLANAFGHGQWETAVRVRLREAADAPIRTDGGTGHRCAFPRAVR